MLSFGQDEGSESIVQIYPGSVLEAYKPGEAFVDISIHFEDESGEYRSLSKRVKVIVRNKLSQTYAPLRLASTKQTKNSIKLGWKKVYGAKKYVIYGGKGSKKAKVKKLKTVGASKLSYNIKKLSGRKLKKGTYYKFRVAALDENNKVIYKSKDIYVATKGNRKKSNPKKVIVKSKVSKTGKKLAKWRKTSSITLSKGRTTTLKTSFTKARRTKVKKFAGIRYASGNKRIATVTSKGKVKAIREGSAKIYCYAQNGKCTIVTVKVK